MIYKDKFIDLAAKMSEVCRVTACKHCDFFNEKK